METGTRYAGSIGSAIWVVCDFTPIDTTYFVVPIDGKVNLRWAYHLLAHEDLSRLNRATGVELVSEVSAPLYAAKLSDDRRNNT